MTAPRVLERVLEIGTPVGAARVHLHRVKEPRAAVVLGHGAGGGIAARDLVTVRDVALSESIAVGLVEQPYRVAGRRSPPAAAQLDAAWTAVLAHLRGRQLKRLPVIVGGRSSGARVACRTAAQTNASAVLCLAFPLKPPGREAAASRLSELEAVTVPTLVVQGSRDPFGIPPNGPHRTVVLVEGDHSLRTDLSSVADAVRGWLPEAVEEAVGAAARHA